MFYRKFKIRLARRLRLFVKALGEFFKTSRQNALYAFIGLDKATDVEEERAWLVRQFERTGFHSYLNMRHATITKELFLAAQRRDWPRVTELNGQRLEVVKLKGAAKREYDAQKRAEREAADTRLIKKQALDLEEEFYKN